MYSQNLEEQHIIDYFGNLKGTVLDIGANDGKTYSNSLRLIELGWKGVLVEPSPSAFAKIQEIHNKIEHDVFCMQVAIGLKREKMIFHESGCHLKDKSDFSLLSSLKSSETDKWKKSGVVFKEIQVDVITFNDLIEVSKIKIFDFITIDAEGIDIDILKQINLSHTKLLCIEWNNIIDIKKQILDYTSIFGMNKIIYESVENLLICRK